jgi:hypothetical protein
MRNIYFLFDFIMGGLLSSFKPIKFLQAQRQINPSVNN